MCFKQCLMKVFLLILIFSPLEYMKNQEKFDENSLSTSKIYFSYQIKWLNLFKSLRGKYCLIHLEIVKRLKKWDYYFEYYLKHDNISPHPAQHYLYWIRLQRKIIKNIFWKMPAIWDTLLLSASLLSLIVFVIENICLKWY
jgi:hypothetical protein